MAELRQLRAFVAVAAIDGERLLAWNPPGTAYTDMLVATATAGGADVTPVEAHITGGTSLHELAEVGAIALAARHGALSRPPAARHDGDQ